MWNTTEAVNIEAAIFAVLAHDVTDFEDSLLVLVHLAVAHLSMQRVLVGDLQITQCKVDGNCHLHLPALREIVEQTRAHVHLELVE